MVRETFGIIDRGYIMNEGETNKSYVYPSRSNLWVGYYVMYDFILNELFPERKKEFPLLEKVIKATSDIHMMWCFPEVVVISDFPESIKLNEDKRLHNGEGASLRYRDGFEIFSLNGVRVTKEVALLTAKEITKEIILKEKNADVRREIVRKLSATQLVSTLGGNVIDTYKDYELLLIDLGDNRKRPFLKMINPSLGVPLVEGVHPDVRTVKDALNYRNGLNEYVDPIALT